MNNHRIPHDLNPKVSLALMLGWTSAECKNLTDSCKHQHTDGTHRCIECGMTSLSFESSASGWIDTHQDELVDLILKGRLTLIDNRLEGVKIIRIHSRHYLVSDTSKTPVVRLWDAVIPTAEPYSQSQARNLEIECVAWLNTNGYTRIPHSEVWAKAAL